VRDCFAATDVGAAVARGAGELISETFGYGGGRSVTVYVPSAPVEAVVFAADGGWHTSRLVDALEAGDAPSTMIVGVHGRDDDDGRFTEYVPGVDETRFAEHEEFFLGEVAEWVRSRFGAAVGANRTGVWGASLGGEFALAMGMRHPDVYGVVFSASPGGGYRPAEPLEGALPSVYLVAGKEEAFFAGNAERWLNAIRDADGDVVMNVRDGDHGGAFWYEEFPLMVSWAFRREPNA
jgi:enterochelin esterase-like enzyme